jgi:hypothetical protein
MTCHNEQATLDRANIRRDALFPTTSKSSRTAPEFVETNVRTK